MRMKKGISKFISMLLAFSMVLSTMAVNVFAEDTTISFSDYKAGTYDVDASLSCYVYPAMGGVEFGESIFDSAAVTVSDDGEEAEITVNFKEGTTSIYSLTVDLYAGESGTFNYKNASGEWVDAETTVEDGKVISMTFTVTEATETYALGVYVASSTMSTQFGGSDDASYAATLTVDWSTFTGEKKEAAPATYAVTVETAENGTVEASAESAAEGETVTLEVTPDEGYELDALSVKDAGGSDVAVKDNAFTMPASAVTVTATFKEVVVDEPAPDVRTATVQVEKFGYDVTVKVTLENNKISNIEITSAVESSSTAATSTGIMNSAINGLKTAFNGMGATDAKSISAVDAVTGATLSSKAIRDAVLEALELDYVEPDAVTKVALGTHPGYVVKGKTQQYAATVTKTGNATEGVTWTVEGGVEGTTISTDGLLKVDAGETAKILTVKATSEFDSTKSAQITVQVEEETTVDFKTKEAGTYNVEGRLSCYVYPAMGGAEFGAPLYDGATLTIAEDGTAALTLNLKETAQTKIYGQSADLYVLSSGTTNYKNAEGWKTAQTTTTTTEKYGDVVTSMVMENVTNSNIQSLGMMVTKTQFGGSDNATYAATLFLDWNTLTKVEEDNTGDDKVTLPTVAGTYDVDASLSCYVYPAMGGVEFGAPLLTDTKVTIDEEGNAEMTLYFGTSSVKIQGVTCAAFVDATADGALTNYYNGKTWSDATYTLSQNTAQNATNEAVNYVETMTFPITAAAKTYSLGLYVNSNVMGVQFGGSDNAKYAATLTVDWSTLKAADDDSTEGEEPVVETYSATVQVEQFGKYNVTVTVTVTDGIITDIAVEGSNFSGTYAEMNQNKLAAAAEGMKTALVGKAANDANAIAGADAVTSATYSSEAIREAVMEALNLAVEEAAVRMPKRVPAAGEYTATISFYSDVVYHSLVGGKTAEATITVDANGNMFLTIDVVNGTSTEPLYVTDFHGYYDANGNLAAVDAESEDGFAWAEFESAAAVTKVTFPLVGGFKEEYVTNARMFVPAMASVDGQVGDILFDHGAFDVDCIVEILDWGFPESAYSSASSSSGGGGGGSVSQSYSSSVDSSIKNGSVSLSKTKAKAGTAVTLTVTPDAGYVVGEVTILDKNGKAVSVKDNGDGTYTFTMPKGGVSVDASFVEGEAPAADTDKTEEKTEIALTIGSQIVQINGNYTANDAAPMIRGERTVLPIRVIAEALGATVAWNEAEQSVTIVKGDMTIVLYIGQAYALVNGEPVELDAPAFIENSRTYLPLRFVAENLGADITWNDATKTVTIVAK